jgi:nucleoside-diphosphate-sugar epimerase
VDGDLRDQASLEGALHGVDAVVHLAGLIAALREHDFLSVNAAGTSTLAKAAAEAGVKRFVYVSSLAAQGPAPDGVCPLPGDEARPVSAYGRSKLAGERAALAFAHAMSVAVVRPPVVYGPRDRGLLPLFRLGKLGLLPLYGDGLNQVSWVHAHDAASATVATVLADGPSGSVYSITDGAAHTWVELATLLSKHFKRRPLMFGVPSKVYGVAGGASAVGSRLLRKPLPLNPDKLIEMREKYWLCSNDLIEAELGWRPEVDAESGVAMTLRWYREHRWV